MTEILGWLWPHLGDGCAYGVVVGLLGLISRSRRRRNR